MKKFKKILSVVSAAALCALPMTNGAVVNATNSSPMKTYVVYTAATRSDIAFFDYALNYESDVNAEESIPTHLLDNGYFSSIHKNTYYKLQNTYNGPAIGSTGAVASTKFVVSMDTESIYDKVTFSNVVVRNANGVTLPPTSLVMEEVLLGDVNLDGAVTAADASLVLSYLANPSAYNLSEKQKDAADVCNRGDGITPKDSLTIQKYVAGQISNF